MLCGNIDGGITIWDYQKRCKLYQLETWPKSLELLRRQARVRQTQPSSHTLQDTIVLLLFWKYIPDIVAVFYDDRIDIFNLFSKELISQTFIPKFFPTAAIVLKHRYNLLCISCMDGTIRIFDRLQNKIVHLASIQILFLSQTLFQQIQQIIVLSLYELYILHFCDDFVIKDSVLL